MDWTWRLDTVVPRALELAVIGGGLLGLLAWLAGGLSLLGRRAVRVAVRLVVLLELGLVLAGHEEAAMLSVALSLLATLGAVSVSAVVLVGRLVRRPASRAALAVGLVLLWDGSHTAARIDWPSLTLVLVAAFGLLALAGSAALRAPATARALAAAWTVWAVTMVGFGRLVPLQHRPRR